MPSAPVTDGGLFIFDVNAAQAGGITHTNGSAEVNIAQNGTYYAHFLATVTPAGTDTFPVTNLVTFRLGGQTQSAGAAQTIFTAAGQTSQVNAAFVFTVTGAPETLAVASGGGNFLYSEATLNVFRV